MTEQQIKEKHIWLGDGYGPDVKANSTKDVRSGDRDRIAPMTNTMNQPKLETLDYKPECNCKKCLHLPGAVLCPDCLGTPTIHSIECVSNPCNCPEQPTSAPRKVKENFTPIIEPETGDEKSKGVGQPLEQPNEIHKLRERHRTPARGYERPEQPNTNAMIIKTIQGLMHVITNNLEKLPDEPLRRMALDDIGVFEAGVLYKLQLEYA